MPFYFFKKIGVWGFYVVEKTLSLCYTPFMNKENVKKSIILLASVIALNIGLAIAKLYVGLSSNSLCVMLDGMNSFLDIFTALASVIALLVVLRSKGDNMYGRSEYLASFVVSVVAVVLGGLFLVRSVNRLAMPEPVWFGVQSTAIISVALVVKLAIGLFCHFFNKKLDSVVVKAITLDSFLDVGVTATSLVSYVVSGSVDYAVDAILGIVMSVVILVFAVKMVVASVKTIVIGDDTTTLANTVKEIVKKDTSVLSVEKISFHDYGTHQKVGTALVCFDEENLSSVLEKCQILQKEIYNETGMKVQVVPSLREGEKYE